ncbi:MAG: DUF1559 domain-containing protein, partial [Planctomycetaceae bacterium]
SQCQDHIHNLVIAIHNYESNFKRIPPGYVVQNGNATGNPPPPNGTLDTRGNWSWTAMILREIEQKPLYDALQVGTLTVDQAWSVGTNANGMRTPIDVLNCPSDPGDDLSAIGRRQILFSTTGNPGALTGEQQLMKVNYVAANDDGSNNAATSPGFTGTRKNNTADGSFYANSNTRFADVIDGTSNCIWLGERASRVRGVDLDAAVGLAVRGNIDMAITGASPPETNNESLRYALFTALIGVSQGQINVTTPVDCVNPSTWAPCKLALSSAHPGGVQVGLGDGKTTFISENIDAFVYANLIRKADGNPVRVP